MRTWQRCLVWVAIGTGTGCGAGWQRAPVSPARSLDPRQQVQVWSNGKSHQWHGVEVTRDSISGVSYVVETTCDACRTAVPLAAVDSLRYGSPVDGFWKSATLVGVVAIALAFVFCCPAAT